LKLGILFIALLALFVLMLATPPLCLKWGKLQPY
jgi:hypothetical protein